MNTCLECAVETKNPKFCGRSCAVRHNNRVSPKRKLEGSCSVCKSSISASKRYCDSCVKAPSMVPSGQRPVTRNTKQVGDRCEMEILYRLTRSDILVSLPAVGENQRYDMIADDGERLYRIQCKSGRLVNGAVLFATMSSHHHRGGKPRGYQGAAELFGVYCPDTDEIYFISPWAIGTQGSLRVATPANGQLKKVRWASDFQWGPDSTLADLEAKR